ncbi:hypothetical protein H112_07752 [Trichophyton rubrum D6]|nr:uncharacterized protein TERG_00349 [Trichophyton rubrum CBS 118892]EZF11027.1 hypothetical protein H100_07776 [Trichophyton rubrum MR850]EZF37901.1 hypothetical protein H102_07741 [Trichophyton rubrum CBS 100081]EZF48536.1 hypothetical protein H103_07764 [Trichophyton rubrum CBS 288.86]EZF59177.1 hypothetical protein H104_07713 [Trichophyton rubrum CBS 289.86]EZF69940.1 hypothetical protein H105_07766 [Trichophyton soudanense CBS 452.61]EZF80565.1 hypothetical protein H110_07762 [Trichophy
MQRSASLELTQRPNFVRQFVKADSLTDGVAAKVLRDSVLSHISIILRNSDCKGLTDIVDFDDGDEDGNGQIILYWRDHCPQLPPVLADLPIISLQESKHDIYTALPENDTLGTRPGGKHFSEPKPVNPDAENFGILGFIIWG